LHIGYSGTVSETVIAYAQRVIAVAKAARTAQCGWDVPIYVG